MPNYDLNRLPPGDGLQAGGNQSRLENLQVGNGALPRSSLVSVDLRVFTELPPLPVL